mmetsp:Transcript_2192/g.3804  ORF Transcript_2192/g.3804 Transcript_2192/m.3804 type:complete len:83 (+) Transcript_2192:639-887(+)
MAHHPMLNAYNNGGYNSLLFLPQCRDLYIICLPSTKECDAVLMLMISRLRKVIDAALPPPKIIPTMIKIQRATAPALRVECN